MQLEGRRKALMHSAHTGGRTQYYAIPNTWLKKPTRYFQIR